MAGRLTPSRTLALLRESSRVLREEEDPSAALARIGALLVPQAADRAVVYARDNDGRLHALPGPGALVREGSGRRLPGVAPRGAGEPADSVAPDADHPASVACRNVALTWVGGLEGRPLIAAEDGPTASSTIREVALPLVREGEAVGALHLVVDDGSFAPSDLEKFELLGERISFFLESVHSRREVRAARRVKSDFLSVMSHELRTPLTAIVGYADLMEAGIPGPVTPKQARQLDRIKESAWELLELIDGILGYARYEGEDPELLVSLVEPARLVDEALSVVRSRLREKGVELAVSVEPDLAPLRTDREKAVRILFHLLSNAEKFTERGEVAIDVTSERDWVVFRISDTGPGIPEGDVEQIFEPFWQGEQPETRTKGGTGMGLSMARRFADLLSGEIHVESRKGDGSTFTLRLPLEGPHPTFP